MTLNRGQWLALFVSAILAIAYGAAGSALYEDTPPYAWPALFKASSIVVLALIAVWTAGVSPVPANNGEFERAASGHAGDAGSAALQPSGAQTPVSALAVHNKLLAAGLLFGALGDALLAWRRDTFLYGALAFLVGHLCYIALFLRAGIGIPAALRTPWRLAAMAAVLIASVVMTSLLVPRGNVMFAPLGAYTGVLTLMTLTSFTLPASRRLAILGAVLFFISDGFVAAHMFHPIADPMLADWSSFAGWMIYWTGQACLCIGALGLHRPT